jgi:drug/metabolite transporter (DMT)-like permease
LTIIVLVLIISAAFLHAMWNLAAKKAGGDARFSAFFGCLMAVLWAPICIWMSLDILPKWGLREWLIIAVSGVVQYIYSVVLLRGYRLSDLTIVYPVARGSAPVITVAVALLFFNESLSLTSAIGVGAIILGVFAIAGGPRLLMRSSDATKQKIKFTNVRVGVLYGFVTGLLITAYTAIDAYAVKLLFISPILLNYYGNLCRLPLMMTVIFRDVDESAKLWRKQWKYAAFVAVFSPVSYVMVLYALKLAPLSQVAPARELSMLFAVVLGGQLLGEKDRLMRVIGAISIALGVAALLMS